MASLALVLGWPWRRGRLGLGVAAPAGSTAAPCPPIRPVRRRRGPRLPGVLGRGVRPCGAPGRREARRHGSLPRPSKSPSRRVTSRAPRRATLPHVLAWLGRGRSSSRVCRRAGAAPAASARRGVPRRPAWWAGAGSACRGRSGALGPPVPLGRRAPAPPVRGPPVRGAPARSSPCPSAAPVPGAPAARRRAGAPPRRSRRRSPAASTSRRIRRLRRAPAEPRGRPRPHRRRRRARRPSPCLPSSPPGAPGGPAGRARRTGRDDSAAGNRRHRSILRARTVPPGVDHSPSRRRAGARCGPRHGTVGRVDDASSASPHPAGCGAIPARAIRTSGLEDRRPDTTRSPRAEAPRGSRHEKSRRRPTLPGGLPPSTIGAGGLNCRVRNGNGCFPAAMATGNRALGGSPRPSTGREPRLWLRYRSP